MMLLPRRRILIGAAGIVAAGLSPAGLLPAGLSPVGLSPAWATEAEVAELLRTLVGEGPLKPGHVKLDLPQLVENGNAVSMTVDVADAPSRVVSLSVFAGRNPLPHVVTASFGPRSARPRLATRIRLATSQTVLAVAKCADGSCWSDSVDLIVTLAACIE